MASERTHFVDRLLNESHMASTHPVVSEYIGDRAAAGLQVTLARSVVANVRHGEVSLPADAKADATAIVALNQDEVFGLSPEYVTLTRRQARNAKRIMDSWEPTMESADEFFERMRESTSGMLENAVTAPHPSMGANTRTIAGSLNIEYLTEIMGLQKPPEAKMGKLMLRPLVVVRMGNSNPDILCHELTHANQKNDRPLRLYSSQDDVDMDSLRDELEAYHVGAAIRLALDYDLPERHKTDPHKQIEAEYVRKTHNSGYLDPFAPSPSLLAKYHEEGMGNILHGIFNYELQAQNLGITS